MLSQVRAPSWGDWYSTSSPCSALVNAFYQCPRGLVLFQLWLLFLLSSCSLLFCLFFTPVLTNTSYAFSFHTWLLRQMKWVSTHLLSFLWLQKILSPVCLHKLRGEKKKHWLSVRLSKLWILAPRVNVKSIFHLLNWPTSKRDNKVCCRGKYIVRLHGQSFNRIYQY